MSVVVDRIRRLLRSQAAQVVINLAAQQLSVRYRRAWMGLGWMILVPLATTSVTALALAAVLHVGTTTLLAHIIVSTLPFTLFSTTIVTASQSLVQHQAIIRRHSVDRMVFPVSALVVAIVEYLGASTSLVILGPFLGLHFGLPLLALPLGFLCVAASAIGLGMLGSIGILHLRDLTHVIQVVLGLVYWLTPIVYTLQMVPPGFAGLLSLNPLTYMLALYTEPLLHGGLPSLQVAAGATISATLLFACGTYVFRQQARRTVFYL